MDTAFLFRLRRSYHRRREERWRGEPIQRCQSSWARVRSRVAWPQEGLWRAQLSRTTYLNWLCWPGDDERHIWWWWCRTPESTQLQRDHPAVGFDYADGYLLDSLALDLASEIWAEWERDWILDSRKDRSSGRLNGQEKEEEKERGLRYHPVQWRNYRLRHCHTRHLWPVPAQILPVEGESQGLQSQTGWTSHVGGRAALNRSQDRTDLPYGEVHWGLPESVAVAAWSRW